MTVPNNTIFEREPVEGLDGEAKLVFKLLLLEFGKVQGHDATMTPTEIIDTYESLRRRGFIRIIQNSRGDFSVKVTPTGAAESWSLSHS